LKGHFVPLFFPKVGTTTPISGIMCYDRLLICGKKIIFAVITWDLHSGEECFVKKLSALE